MCCRMSVDAQQQWSTQEVRHRRHCQACHNTLFCQHSVTHVCGSTHSSADALGVKPDTTAYHTTSLHPALRAATTIHKAHPSASLWHACVGSNAGSSYQFGANLRWWHAQWNLATQHDPTTLPRVMMWLEAFNLQHTRHTHKCIDTLLAPVRDQSHTFQGPRAAICSTLQPVGAHERQKGHHQ